MQSEVLIFFNGHVPLLCNTNVVSDKSSTLCDDCYYLLHLDTQITP